MMNCKQAIRMMSEEMERELPFGERAALRLHTALCIGCRNYRRQMAILRAACRRIAGGSPNDETVGGD